MKRHNSSFFEKKGRNNIGAARTVALPLYLSKTCLRLTRIAGIVHSHFLCRENNV